MTDHRMSLEFMSYPQLALGDVEIGMLRLRTLVRLRWLAIVGQAGAVLGVHFVLGFPVPLGLCLGAIALSAWLNIFLTIRWRKSVRLHETHAGLLLVYDVLQLAVLLYLTGGLENPFSFLFLVPVTISATSLTMRWTLWLGLMAFACATFLAFQHYPLPWVPGERMELPEIYIAGMWAAIVCGVVFSAIYARRIADEARQMSTALSATEMVLAREQRLSALDGLAAAAAHELGTPLATIALVAKELKRELPAKGPHTEDIDLLISQTARCREILARLANREAQTDEMYQRTKILVMVEDLIAPLRGSYVVIAVTSSADADEKALEDETGPQAQSRHYIWSWKPSGERSRLRRDAGRGRCALDIRTGLTDRPRRRTGFSREHLRPAGRSLRDHKARLWRRNRRARPP